ncbi:MAG: deoxyguanosinetriphosphate triphosphohydrolase [Bacillota bacterium]
MCLREETERIESETLSSRACLSSASQGRRRDEEPCEIRTCFQRDRDRIIHSKSFRRLKHKTQVFVSPEGDHFRTRLTHTLEVAQIARTITRALHLNEDLAEAIALGHDLGHTPFGHAGEEALNTVYPEGFKHNRQSLRVVDVLEQGTGMNLTQEVRDGILHHTGPETPETLEGQIVKISDRIAYINHDIDDALRAGIIKLDDLPSRSVKVLGEHHRGRINTMVIDMINSSEKTPYICMSPEVQKATDLLRKFLFDQVYIGSMAKTEESKAKRLVRELYYYYQEYPGTLPAEKQSAINNFGLERVICDYIAGMTDRYATAQYINLFVPQGFKMF